MTIIYATTIVAEKVYGITGRVDWRLLIPYYSFTIYIISYLGSRKSKSEDKYGILL